MIGKQPLNPNIRAFKELSPEIGARTIAHSQNKKNKREQQETSPFGELYTRSLGYYGKLPKHERSALEIARRLTEMEEILDEEIEMMMRAKAESEHQLPTVALDLGGMFGLTFAKLANRHQSDIKEGKLALVVTNMAFDVHQALEKYKLTNDAPYREKTEIILTPAEITLISSNEKLLHYLQCDVVELRSQILSLPNGVSLPLKGNINIVHEQSAFAWDPKIDVDLPLLGTMMSKEGIIFLGSEDDKLIPYPPQYEKTKNAGYCLDPYHQGLYNLKELGFNIQTTRFGGGNYKILSKPSAPVKESWLGENYL